MDADDALGDMRLPWSSDKELPPADPAVARLLAAAAAPPDPGEVAGEHAAVAAFIAAGRTPSTPLTRRPLVLKRVTARIASLTAATAIGATGIAAAYAGVLPAAPQNVAHAALGPLGVPGHHDHGKHLAKGHDKSTDTAEVSDEASTGPDANGSAHHGLCTAWAASGKPKNPNSTAFANLVTAAGGVDKVVAFCADAADGKGGDDHGQSGADHGKSGADHGKPTAKPSHSPGADDSSDAPEVHESHSPEAHESHAPEPQESESHSPDGHGDHSESAHPSATPDPGDAGHR